MANKLKDIFSDDMFDLGGRIHFQSHDDYNKFLESLKIVQDNGKSVKLEGITSIKTEIKDRRRTFPLSDINDILEVTVAPSKEDVEIDLDTRYGKKSIHFQKYQISEGIVLETNDKEIVYIKITFISDFKKTKFMYRAQPQYAKTITKVIENYGIMIDFLNHTFKYDNEILNQEEKALISYIKNYFLQMLDFYKKLQKIEQDFNLKIAPKDASELEEDERAVYELYLLLYEKKIIRLNRKLTATDTTGMKIKNINHKPTIGDKIEITFRQELEFSILDNKILIYSASLISNAIIKEIIETDDGTVKIKYDDIDSDPMFISYSGFKTNEEANKEMSSIMNYKEKYVSAATLDEYIREENKKYL